MKKGPFIVIIIFTLFCNLYVGVFSGEANIGYISNFTGPVTRNEEVTLEGFTFQSVDSQNPLVISHIGDIDDDSNYDLIGFNNTHKFKINYNVTNGAFDFNPILNNSELYLPRNLEFIDFNADNRLEAMGSNLSLYQWNNDTLDLIKINNVSGAFVPSYGDMDSDGDIDIINRGRPDGFYFIKNLDNGSFQYDTSDRNGLPEFIGHPSREYYAMSYMFEDLNNDGWLDVCTGMGDRYGMYPGQDYFWLSNGDGSWKEFSEGCPTWDYGVDIDSSDFDNDGDQDFLINLKHNGTTIFQNNYPNEWKLIQLPRSEVLSSYSDSYHKIGDMDNNGWNDIVLPYSMQILDKDENVIGYKYRIGILYNLGNLSFKMHLSNDIDINGLNLLPLTDLDQDGSLDIVISPTNPNTDGWSSFVLFNNFESANELELRPSWGSNTLRAGSYLNFDLMSNKKYLYNDMNVNFNISISYFGINGPYSPLIQNLSKWWTYWTVPNFPSNNAFLKIEGMGMMTHYGPLTIYSKNDSKYLVEASFSVSGNYLYGGREVDIFLKPDPNVVETLPIDLTLEYANGTFDLGSHLVNPGAITSFRWTVPIDLFEPDCRLVENLTIEGSDVVVVSDEGYNILDDSTFLEEIRGNDTLLTWRGYTSELDIRCLSKDWTDLTHSSKFDITSTSEYFTAAHAGEGTIQIIGREIGEDWLRVDIECFGVRKTFSSYISVEKSIGSMNISKDFSEVHTGDEINLFLSIRDLLNQTVDFESDEIEWNISGPGVIRFLDYDHIVIFCNGIGTIQVSVEVNIGYGPVKEIYSFDVLPFISDVRLSMSGPIVIDKEVEIIAEVYDWEGEISSGFGLSWNISGNATCSFTTNNRISVILHDNDPLYIELGICYFNEFLTKTFHLSANLSLSEMDISYQTLDIPLDGAEYIEIIPKTFNGSTYPFDVEIEFIKENPEIISHRVDGNRIMLIGQKVGTTEVEIRVKTSYDQVKANLTVNVYNIPYDVLLHSTTDLVRKVDYHLDFEIVDRSLNLLPNNSYEIDIENATFSENYDQWNVIAFECGTFRITFNVKIKNITLVKIVDLNVFPYWDHMDYSEIISHIRVGDDLRIEPILVLENGNITGLTDLHIISENSLDIEYYSDGAIIKDVPYGPLVLSIRGCYLGILVEEEFELNALEKPILTYINITFHNSTEEIIVEVTAFDQYGINITDICTFHYVGEIVLISDNIIKMLNDRLTIIVSLNDHEIFREVELNSGNHERWIEPMTLFLIAMVILFTVILLGVVIARKYLFISDNGDNVIDAPLLPEE